MDDLNRKLDRLNENVKVHIEKRQKARKDAWNNLRSNHPDQAEYITAISSVFGKPKIVIVKDETGIVLDSRKLK